MAEKEKEAEEKGRANIKSYIIATLHLPLVHTHNQSNQHSPP
jgi:hypothetical protein